MHFPLNIHSDFDPTSPDGTFYKPEPSPALDAARQTYPVRKFLEFAQYPLWRVTPLAEPEGAQRVAVSDWRFPFTAGATVDRSNRVLSSSFHF